jgi:Rieske 2Fe-2S family protein
MAPVEGFDPADYPLYDIAVRDWHGFVFVNLAGGQAKPFAQAFDRGSDRLDNWPLDALVSGHVYETVMACNWKVFWENFNECLHCPGVHPELCDTVPIYGRAIMGERDDPNFPDHADIDDPKYKGGLRPGAQTWSMDGRPQGPGFPGLTDAERKAGQSYVTSLPSAFIVAHVDYVRVVRLRPLGPERTELHAEWLFPAETLADPKFDMANVVDFAVLVMEQDARACELNQAGLRSIRHEAGVLMAEEYYVHRFHEWVNAALKEGA